MTQTVFILGAGSSVEAGGIPTGEGLTSAIGSLLKIRIDDMGSQVDGSLLIGEALRLHASSDAALRGNVNPYLHAARQVSEAMPLAESIDNFLHAHRADKRIELCGKVAIVQAILAAERGSRMYTDPRRPDIPLSLEGLRGTWFSRFWHRYSEDCTRDELEPRSKSAAFVVFHYDRCVEQFLFYAAQAYYGLRADEAAQAMQKIRIFHPYGSVGALPWMKQSPAAHLGGDVNAAGLLELSAKIKTFTEGADPDSSSIEEIREVINAADRVVFLGFAFHRQNLRLLWPAPVAARLRTANRRFFGTAHGISASDVQLIVNDLEEYAGVAPGDLTLRSDLKCQGLFHEYSHSLSLR